MRYSFRQKCKLITNIDISENVIKRMQKKAEETGRQMIYEVGDVTNLKYRSGLNLLFTVSKIWIKTHPDENI